MSGSGEDVDVSSSTDEAGTSTEATNSLVVLDETDNQEMVPFHEVNGVDESTQTQLAKQLHAAVVEQNNDRLEDLVIRQHADVNAVNQDGKTALFVAVEAGWTEGVLSLVRECGADVAIVNGPKGQTALQLAVSLAAKDIRGNETLDAVIGGARGSDKYREIMNVRDVTQKTPLIIAILGKNRAVVGALLAAGADITLRDQNDRNVLHCAVLGKTTAENGKMSGEIMDDLLQHRKKKIDALKEEMKTIEKEDRQSGERDLANIKLELEATEQMLGQRCKGAFEGTPLLMAVHFGEVASLKSLVKSKATFLGRADILLPERKAKKFKVSFRDSKHTNATLRGGPNSNESRVEPALVDKTKGKTADTKVEHRNCNVLHLAAIGKKTLVIDFLKNNISTSEELKTLVSQTNDSGATPLHLALLDSHRQIDFIYALLAAGSDLAAKYGKDGNEKTAAEMLRIQEPSSVGVMKEAMDRAIKLTKNKVFTRVHFKLLMPQRAWTEVEDTKGANEGVSNGSATDHTVVIDPDDAATALLLPKSNASADDNPRTESKHVTADPKDDFRVLNVLRAFGEESNQHDLLDHPLVESFLYLHWKKLKIPYMIHLAFNFLFTALLTFEAVLAVTQPEITTTLWILKGGLFFLVAVLIVHEIECLCVDDKPTMYWLELLIKTVCFTTCVLSLLWPSDAAQETTTSSSEHRHTSIDEDPPSSTAVSLYITAVLLAWFELAVLVSRVRQCYGLGLKLIVFGKAMHRCRNLFFSLVMSAVCVDVVLSAVNGTYAFGYRVLALYVTGVSFVGLLLALFYTVLRSVGRYQHWPLEDKMQVLTYHMEFLETYEGLVLGARPGVICFRGRGIVYNAYIALCWALRRCAAATVAEWESYEVVKQRFKVSSSKGAKHPDTSDWPTLVFPIELQRAIQLKGLETQENARKNEQKPSGKKEQKPSGGGRRNSAERGAETLWQEEQKPSGSG